MMSMMDQTWVVVTMMVLFVLLVAGILVGVWALWMRESRRPVEPPVAREHISPF